MFEAEVRWKSRNGSGPFPAVMAGLDPAIHDYRRGMRDVDARVKPGHDDKFWIDQEPLVSARR
jgi:hypothetical protein